MKWNILGEDLTETPVKTTILFLQIFIAILLFSLAVGRTFHQTEYKTIVTSLGNKNGMYYLLDNTDNAVLNENIMNNPSALPNLKSLYKYLFMNSEINCMSFHFEPILENPQSQSEESIINMLYANDAFWDTFKLKTTEKRSLKNSNLMGKDKLVPIFLGASFQINYKIGDTFGDKYIIQDFLLPGQYYVNPKESNEIILLDNMAICPLDSSLEELGGDYAWAILNSVIFTDQTDVMNEIVKKSSDLGLFTLSYRSYAEQLDYIMEDLQFQIELSSFILAALASLSALGLVSAILEFIESHKREFTIHLLCGASPRDIFLRVLCPVGVFLLLSNLLSLLIYRDGAVFFYTLLFSLGLGGLISVLPCVKLSRMNFNAALRKE